MIRLRRVLVLLLLLLCSAPLRAQGPELPAFAQPYPNDNPSPVELFPRVLPGHVVQPGDADWPLGPVRQRGFAYEVIADAEARSPVGAASFRVDYEFTPRVQPSPSAQVGASPSAPALSGDLACLASATRRDAAKTRGIRFAMRASSPTRAVITINASNADDQRKVDRFYGSFTVGTEWKIVTIHYRSLARWPGAAGATGAGGAVGTPGDGVLRPDRIEEIRVGLDAVQAPPGRGSFWVGDVTFFR